MVLREKLIDTNMIGSYMMTNYLTWIRQVRDELVAVGETMDDSELVRTSLEGLTKEWTPLIKRIMAQEMLHDWSRLWDEFVKEELQDEYLNGGRHKNDENLAFVNQTKKGKFKKIASGEYTSQDDNKNDMSKVKCFACHNLGIM
jgi:hypothetical protein